MRISYLLAALLFLGCGSTVIVDPAARRADEATCIDEVPPEDRVALGPVASATLFGGMLHLEGVVDGRFTYAIVDVSRAPARLVEERPDLLGGARWTAVHGVWHARLRNDRLDVIDASDPARVVLVSSTGLGETARDGTLAAAGSGLFFCVASAESAGDALVRVDLADPAHPGAVERHPAHACDDDDTVALAAASLWVRWGGTPGNASVTLFDLAAPGSIPIVSHAFATDGVHQYGALTAARTDGRVVATTMENPAYAFFYYGDRPDEEYVYSSFGSGDKRLLEVVDGEALVLVPEPGDERSVVGFTLSLELDWYEAAPASATSVRLEGAAGALDDFSALAHDDAQLLVADLASVYLVPRGSSTPVERLVVLRQGVEAPGCP
jgi:hypothetical protein